MMYKREIRELIQSALERGSYTFLSDDNEIHESFFLGTVFNLCPSGKYYTPWANSNVTEKEALKDEQWYEDAKDVAKEFNGWIENGEGDPCDIFFVRTSDEPPVKTIVINVYNPDDENIFYKVFEDDVEMYSEYNFDSQESAMTAALDNYR